MTQSMNTSNRSARQLRSGERIFAAGEAGLAWRITRGSVRFDTVTDADKAVFANLAVTGDIVGCESMLFGTYALTASALTDCALEPWPEGCGGNQNEDLLHSLARAQRRATELVALRGGEAMARVSGLIRLLALCGDDPLSRRVVLPPRQALAEITDLRIETVSRIIKTLQHSGQLLQVRQQGINITRSFVVAS
jgi:CRP-like cAMP-binding protein